MATNEKELEQIRREGCRRAVRRYLAERQSVALHHRIIRQRVNEGYANDFHESEVLAALAWLVGDGQVTAVQPPIGATSYYQATSKGVLEHERDGFQ